MLIFLVQVDLQIECSWSTVYIYMCVYVYVNDTNISLMTRTLKAFTPHFLNLYRRFLLSITADHY